MHCLSVLFLATGLCVQAQDTPPSDPAKAPPAKVQFASSQIEQLVAPVALYPDSLLAQILAASTYPVDVVSAARWVKQNSSLGQEEMKSGIQGKEWDPSVKGLVFFPELLAKMNDNLDWTKDLGDAFLAQPQDVMNTIQAMRAKAKEAGTLESNQYQQVTSTDGGQMAIQSTNPETVYVQNYEPVTAYGPNWTYDSWEYPEVIAVPAWPWRRPYACAWALGYGCGWNNRNIVYGNNYYHGDFYRTTLKRTKVDSANRDWTHTRVRTTPYSTTVRRTSGQLDADRQAAQRTRESVRVSSVQGDRTQAAKHALRETERATASVNRTGGQNISPNRSQDISRKNVNHAMRSSGNADLERAYSNRGAQSRSVSAKTTNRGNANVHSKAGSSSRGGGGGAKRSGGGGGGRR
jgi:hypothetical protein